VDQESMDLEFRGRNCQSRGGSSVRGSDVSV